MGAVLGFVSLGFAHGGYTVKNDGILLQPRREWLGDGLVSEFRVSGLWRRSLIQRELGTLSAATQEEIARKLRMLFAP